MQEQRKHSNTTPAAARIMVSSKPSIFYVNSAALSIRQSEE